MLSAPVLEWRFNLRTNLPLWPEVAPNVAALAQCDGEAYDEDALIKKFPLKEGEKTPTDPRAVRNTFEVMALAGLAYRDGGSPDRFRLTALGRSVFSFLGVVGPKSYATPGSRPILADALIRAASCVVEYRAIWMLMLRADGMLSNEELNRAMARIKTLRDIPVVAMAIRRARRRGDPTSIGQRIYEDDRYADPAKREDQRKAMNPLFLLAGGGRLFISMDDGDPFRRLEDWAAPLIERRLREVVPFVHAATDAATIRTISDQAAVPDLVYTV